MKIPGFRFLCMGGVGSGKTYSLRTLVDAGLEPFIVFTESQALSVAAPWLDRVHWRLMEPIQSSWSTISSEVRKQLLLDDSGRAKFRDPNRSKFTMFLELLDQMNDFRDHTGKSFGPVEQWGPDRVLVIDTLFGVVSMIKQALVGLRTNMTLQEIGEAQDLLGPKFIDVLNANLKCHFVVTCHYELAIDQVHGGQKYLPTTFGNKQGPVLPRWFNEFVWAYREGGNWYWSTTEPRADVKANLLPFDHKIPQDYRIVLREWKKRCGG